MKIGILTFRWANNYGAVLQAYALLRTLQRFTQDVEFLNYAPASKRWQGLYNWGLRSGTFSKMLPLRLAFMHFRRKYLPATAMVSSSTDLARLASRYDTGIVGSDQVWNGRLHGGHDPAYFLDFSGDRDFKRISYAACFGQPDQPYARLTDIGIWLQRFNSISVRNELSRDLVRQLSGRDAQVVLDPTLLWDFDELLGRTTRKAPGYILVYGLSDDHSESIETVVRETARRTGLQVISLWPTVPLRSVTATRLCPGPVGWLRLFRDAEYVCTDSFHGCCFAVKFGKQLLCWPGARSQRLMDFLSTFGLEGRLLGSASPAGVERTLRHEIEYDQVHQRLQREICSSLDFLKSSLSAVDPRFPIMTAPVTLSEKNLTFARSDGSPCVSIIIPTYNRKQLLREAVESCLQQTFQDYEVLIVDDGSTDGTGEQAETLLKLEWREKVRYHRKVNGGVSSAKNCGLKFARGEYVQFLDSDDLLRPEKLAKQVAAIRSSGKTIDCCICFGRMGLQDEGWERATLIGEAHNTPAEYIQDLCSRKLHVICTNAPLWRRTFLAQVEGWREDLLASEEWEYYTRLMTRNPEILFVAEELFFVRGHAGDQLSKRYVRIEYMASHYRATQSVARLLVGTPHWKPRARADLLLRARMAYVNLLRHGDKRVIEEFEDWFSDLARSVPDYRMVAIVGLRRLFGSQFVLSLYGLRARLR